MDVCAKLQGIFHERRVGHAGTLDPMATGVLPVFVGRATRAVEFASESEKEYVAGLRLGVVTNTQDTTGTGAGEAARACGSGRSWRRCWPPFRGEITPDPPHVLRHQGGTGRSSMSWPGRAGRWSGSPGPSPSTALDAGGADGAGRTTPCGCGAPRGPMCAPSATTLGRALGCGGLHERPCAAPMAAGFKLDGRRASGAGAPGGSGPGGPASGRWTPTLLTALR